MLIVEKEEPLRPVGIKIAPDPSTKNDFITVHMAKTIYIILDKGNSEITKELIELNN